MNTKRKKVNSTHRKLEQISNIYFVFWCWPTTRMCTVCAHYLIHIFPNGFDKGTRRQKKNRNQNTSHSSKTMREKNRPQTQRIHNHAWARHMLLHIYMYAYEHPLNLAYEINEPDNKSLHINFYRFDCGKIGSGKTTKSQLKKSEVKWSDVNGAMFFLYSSATDNQMHIMDRFYEREGKKDWKKNCNNNIISSWNMKFNCWTDRSIDRRTHLTAHSITPSL